MTTYRIVVDGSLCSGFGSCLEHAPSTFELAANGVAVARVTDTDDPVVIEAAQACPMGAIAVTDAATGGQVA